MKTFKTLFDLELKDQVYIILGCAQDSWKYNALHQHFSDKEWCQNVVNNFLEDHEPDEKWLVDEINEVMPEIIEFWKRENKI